MCVCTCKPAYDSSLTDAQWAVIEPLLPKTHPSLGGRPPVHSRRLIIDTISSGDLLGWSWMFSPYTWHFTARAIEPTEAIFFYGTILREHCERDPSLGYELFKRMAPVMLRRLQAARKKMLAIHARTEQLQPAITPAPNMASSP